jgi:hypothetical protein
VTRGSADGTSLIPGGGCQEAIFYLQMNKSLVKLNQKNRNWDNGNAEADMMFLSLSVVVGL